MRDGALIVHIVFRFDYGGLENGVVNVINGLSEGRYRHVVIALTEATEFAARLRGDVVVKCIGKRAGKDFPAYVRLFRELRRLRPDIVHTRNLSTLECAFVAFLAGVPVRIHGEHGWDVFDPDGTRPKYRLMRRFVYRFVNRVVAVSEDLEKWLVRVVGIPPRKVRHICNGVDTERFKPAAAKHDASGEVVIGTVTRFEAIKDPRNLIEAFIMLREAGHRIRLVMIGDGELYAGCKKALEIAGETSASWLPGSRDDIAEQLRSMDVFVLGSLREGISNTLLEAMSSGLPVVATDTGGNRELVEPDLNGVLVPPGDRDALSQAIREYVVDPSRRIKHGRASRDRVMSRFSLVRMIDEYRSLYGHALQTHGV